MKKLSLIALAIFSTLSVFAQLTEKGGMSLPAIQEEEKTMSKGLNPAFVFTLDGVSKSEAEKEWKDFTKDLKAKAKKDRKSKEWLSDDAKISNISTNTVDVYADIRYESKEVSTLYVWFDLGGAYVNSETHADASEEANRLLQNFIITVYKHKAEDAQKAEEKVLASFEKDLKKLEKDNKDYHKKIEEAKELIAKMEKNIEVNIEDQAKKQVEIETQKGVITKAIEHVKSFKKIEL